MSDSSLCKAQTEKMLLRSMAMFVEHFRKNKVVKYVILFLYHALFFQLLLQLINVNNFITYLMSENDFLVVIFKTANVGFLKQSELTYNKLYRERKVLIKKSYVSIIAQIYFIVVFKNFYINFCCYTS